MKIGQREARRLKKRVEELEAQRRAERAAWSRSYPDGMHLGSLPRERDWFQGRLEAAQLLKCPLVVVVNSDENELRFYALPA